MSKFTARKQKLHSQHALLCLIGQKAQELKLLDPLHKLVKIDQKTLVRTPTEKLTDAMLAIACGAEALSQLIPSCVPMVPSAEPRIEHVVPTSPACKIL